MTEVVEMTQMNVAMIASDLTSRAKELGFDLMFTGSSVVVVGGVSVELMSLMELSAFLEGCEYWQSYGEVEEGEDDS